MAEVSVIIPTYNRLWSLARAIDSCRRTKCLTEIIVIDDGSNDGTWEWLQSQTDIVFVRQKNMGQTYAINKGISLAKGKFIRFLDSDDFLNEGFIDQQYNIAKETGARLVCSRVDAYEQETGKVISNPEITDWQDFLQIQLGKGYGSHFLGMLFHRDLVLQTPRRPDFSFREDRMFLLEIGIQEPEMAIAPGCAGYWVRHAGQMQANYSGLKMQTANWQHIQIYKRILAELDRTGKLTLPRKEAACDMLWLIAGWVAQNHLKDANEIYNWIKQLYPSFVVPDKGLKGFFYRFLGFSATEKLLRVFRMIRYGWR